MNKNKVYINNKIFKENKISFETLGVYAYLCSFNNKDSINCLSLCTVYKELNIDKKDFKKSINILNKKRYIKIMGDYTNTNKLIYKILV